VPYLGYTCLVDHFGSMDAFYDVSEIKCRVKDAFNVYVSAEGLVLPCCWTAGRMYKWWFSDPKEEQIWDFIDSIGGKDAINAKKVGLRGALQSGLFESIEESWTVTGCANGRLKVCAMKCSKEFDVVRSQWQ